MDLGLKKKIVVIIGASKLSRVFEDTILYNLKEEKAISIILDSNQENFPIARALESDEDKVLFYETDISNSASVERSIRNVFYEYKRIDVIINTIVFHSRISLETSAEVFMNSLNIEKERHSFIRSNTILGLLQVSGGNILNIISNISVIERKGSFYKDTFSRLMLHMEKGEFTNSIRENDFFISKVNTKEGNINLRKEKEKFEAIINMCLFLISKKNPDTRKQLLYHQNGIHFDDINYAF